MYWNIICKWYQWQCGNYGIGGEYLSHMDRNRLPKDDPRIGSPMYPGNRLVTAISVLEAPSAGKLLFIFSFPISKYLFLNSFWIMKINKLQFLLIFRRGNGMAICWNHSIFRKRRWNTMVQSFPKRRSRYNYASQCVSSIAREQMDWKQMDRVQ